MDTGQRRPRVDAEASAVSDKIPGIQAPVIDEHRCSICLGAFHEGAEFSVVFKCGHAYDHRRITLWIDLHGAGRGCAHCRSDPYVRASRVEELNRDNLGEIVIQRNEVGAENTGNGTQHMQSASQQIMRERNRRVQRASTRMRADNSAMEAYIAARLTDIESLSILISHHPRPTGALPASPRNAAMIPALSESRTQIWGFWIASSGIIVLPALFYIMRSARCMPSK